MNKIITKTILVLAAGFIGWGGGVDYLKTQLRLLITLAENNPALQIIVLLPELSRAGVFVIKLKNIIKWIIKWPVYHYSYSDLRDSIVLDTDIKSHVVFMHYYFDKKSGKKSIQKIVKKLIKEDRNPVVCFSFASLRKLKCRQIGYIADLQHKSLPDFFTAKEIEGRNRHYISLLKRCDGIVVNSKNVKDSLLEKYPFYAKEEKIFAAPATPLADKQLLYDAGNKCNRILPEKYFLISNQLWIHKDHKTAFAALKIIRDKGYSDIELVCTGKTDDYRHPLYFSELKNHIEELDLSGHIYFLGFIAKEEQISILRNAISIVQPTLFEGGPGGGAVWDAIAYGVPAIMSDIPVNCEIEASRMVRFFSVGKPEDLAEKMITILENPPARPSTEELVSQRERNLQSGAEFLGQVIGKCMRNKMY